MSRRVHGWARRASLVVAISACAAGAIRSSAAIEPPEAGRSVAERFGERLAALSPVDPESYLLLAEEVLDASTGPADARVAVELFARAFELARMKPGERQVASSACHGLAEATSEPSDRRWFRTLAAVVDPSGGEPGWLRKPPPATVDAMPFRLAVVIGHVRAGEGVVAKQMLAKPEVSQALRAIEPMLKRGGVPGGLSWLQRESESWPCRECSNKGVVRRGGGPQPEHRVCPVCRGAPGPALPAADLLSQIRLEAWLLQGEQRSWSAQLAADDGAPLAEPDPESVHERTGIDAARMYWRRGRWVLHADGSDDPPRPPPATQEPAPPPPTVTSDPTGGAAGG